MINFVLDWEQLTKKKLAEEKYFETRRLDAAGQLHSDISFSMIADGYIESLFEEAKRKPERLGHARHAKSTVNRYLKNYFEDTHITNIYIDDFEEYKEWRRVYWTEGEGKNAKPEKHARGKGFVTIKPQKNEASDSTLKREASSLRGIFKHAVRKRILKQGDVPVFSFGNIKGVKRPSFTKEQFNKLATVSEQRLMDVAINPKLRYERFQLHCFIHIAVNTGMRLGEMFNLDWGHVEGIEEAAKASIRPITDDGKLDKKNDPTITIIAQGKGKRLL